jgi:pyrroline-5-carboxylate reductase
MTLQIDGTLWLAGAGNMGLALLSGWLAQGLPPGRIVVQEPSPSPDAKALAARQGIALQPTLAAGTPPPSVLVVAVKPQVMDEVFAGLAGRVSPRTLVLSIAAGRTIAGFERQLPAKTPVVRAMPNMAVSVGRGITVCVPNAHVSSAERAACDGLLRAVGEVAWVDDEGLLDAVTAVSGSGPAYVFYLAECLAEAGVKAGLPPKLAQQLASATVAGAGELLHRSHDDAAMLRQRVTSTGGTTHAALQVLMADNGLAPLLREAVAAATRRSRELAK